MADRPDTDRREPTQAGHSGRRRSDQHLAAPPVDQVVRLCRALGHPLRVRLVAFLSTAPHGGAYVSELAGYSKRAQSTVSHHLSVLVRAGVVVSEQRGTWSWYRVVPERLAELREHLGAFIATAAAPTTQEVGVFT